MSEQELAILGLVGAGAAAAGLALTGRRAESPSLWFSLTWPREVSPEDVVLLLRSLASDRRRHILAIESAYSNGRLSYRLGIAEAHKDDILAQLRSYLPEVAAQVIEHDTVCAPNFAWQLTMQPSRRSLRTNEIDQVSRALITALTTAKNNKTVLFQWLLGPRLAPAEPSPDSLDPSWTEALRHMVSPGQTSPNNDARKSAREKMSDPGFRAVCRIGVATDKPATALSTATAILGALRTAESPGVKIGLKKDDPDNIALARCPRSWPLAVNVKELAALSSWPLGAHVHEGLEQEQSRRTRPSSAISRTGRVLGLSTFPGSERSLALTVSDSLQHLHILGPTGTGKSTLMLNLAAQDIEAGRGIIVIDPKPESTAPPS